MPAVPNPNLSEEARRPIDTNVQVPRAVRAAAEAANAAHQTAYNPAAPAPTAGDPPPPPAPTASNPPPAPAPTAGDPPPPPPVPDAGSGDTWENRFKASQGRLNQANQTIQQQQGTISQLERNVADVQRVLATMQAAPPAPAPTPVPSELRAESLITPEEREAWGPDFMTMVQKVARSIAAEEVGVQKTEIENLKRQLGGVAGHVQQSEAEKMKAMLTEQIPGWREQNRDPNFLAWLRLPDAYSGVNRGVLLKDAWDGNQTSRVVSIFKGFLSEEAAVSPAAPAAPASDGRPSLADYAAPGRAKTEATPPGGPSVKPNISRAQIASYYADVAAGRYRGRDKEKNDFEQAIFAAQREGRVTS